MINDLDNIDFDEEIKIALSIYVDLYGDQTEVPFETRVTSNMLKTFLELSKDAIERRQWEADAHKLNGLNGSVYFPARVNDKFYLIVHEKRFNEYQIHYQTIAHEYTHILDFFEYSRIFAVKNLQRKENIPNFECIKFYSEVRARFRGALLYYNVISLDRQEVPYAFTSLAKDYSKELFGNFENDCYLLAQFYGQYLALNCYSGLTLERPEWLHQYRVENLLGFLDENINSHQVFPQFNDFMKLFYTNQSKTV